LRLLEDGAAPVRHQPATIMPGARSHVPVVPGEGA
ncbi:nucleotidyltransferase family protein, partial [Mesorhizobium sp. M7A.F.Ca.CA.004.05.2.1]